MTEDTEEFYPFDSNDEPEIDRLVDFLRSLLNRRGIQPEAISALATAIFAAQRFPLVTADIDVLVSLTYTYGKESHNFTINISDDERVFEIYEYHTGLPTKTWVKYAIEERPGGEGSLDTAIDQLVKCAKDSTYILNVFGSDDSFTQWDLPRDDSAWERLKG